MKEKGVLYLVATPIGNLEDITLRAVRVLKEADMIAAEDTRRTLQLLNHLDISKPITSYYKHNENSKGEYILNKLLDGENIALVSDAGTPGISDPGEELVSLAVENNIRIVPVPGPVAAVAGLIVSGLPTGRFVFEGFLPMNKRARKERLGELKEETRTIIFYEAPHKLMHTLEDMLGNLGDRRIVLARELTKVFEEIIRVTLAEAVKLFRGKSPKGEFVLMVEGIKQEQSRKDLEWEELTVEQHVKVYSQLGLGHKEALKKAAEDRGISKRELYNRLVKNKP